MLGSQRQVGKDTLCQRLAEIDARFKRFSFADELKKDVAPFIHQKFGFDIFSCSPEEKELIRPILIAYGMSQRQRDPDYWIKRLVSNINSELAWYPRMIPVITDGRFMNEVSFFRQRYDVTFVQIFRHGAPSPTEEEEKHWPALADQADYVIRWGENSPEEQKEIARKLSRRIL